MKHKILIIDDNADTRSLISFFLTSKNYVVETCENGQEGMTLLKEGSLPHLIILDHDMNVMDGPTFLLTFEKELPLVFSKVPVVMMTAHNADLIKENKATEIFSKMVGIKQILDMVRKYCK